MALRDITFTLLAHVSVGLILTVLFVSLAEIGKLYFRVSTLAAVVLLFLALAAAPMPLSEAFAVWKMASFSPYRFLGLSALLLIVYNLTMPRGHRLFLAGAAATGLAGIGAHGVSLAAGDGVAWSGFMYAMTALGSSLLLGSALGAMITGHWYLVRTNLSLRPLKHSSGIYLAAALARALILAAVFLWARRTGAMPAIGPLLSGGTLTSTLFYGRLLVGGVLPLVLAIMVWRTVAIRSTQSATGILYAATVVGLIGETFGRFLYYATNLPL